MMWRAGSLHASRPACLPSLSASPQARSPASFSSHDRCCSNPVAVLREPDGNMQQTVRRPMHIVQAQPRSDAVEMVESGDSAPPVPSAAETARTVLDIAAHGTLATINEDGKPLGTYASYVLDAEGQPVLRLREGAVHTANLLRSPHCSLFVQASDEPARLLARLTLRGEAEAVSGEEADKAAEQHRTLHGEGAGIDRPQDSDLYYQLRIKECFYVGGLGAESIPEVIPADVLRGSEPDRLRHSAPSLVAQWNAERMEDVFRIAADLEGATFNELQTAQLLWVDRLGLYLFVQRVGEMGHVRRRAFVREVANERDARSVLTMLAQVSWEKERKYQPVMPVLSVGEPDEVAV